MGVSDPLPDVDKLLQTALQLDTNNTYLWTPSNHTTQERLEWETFI